MIKKYNRLSLIFGVPGFFMQGFLFIWGQEGWGLAGIFLFMLGLAFHAKSLGRSPVWGLLGIFSWFSVLVFIFLKDKTGIKESSGFHNPGPDRRKGCGCRGT